MDTALLDEDGRIRMMRDLFHHLIDMGCPESIALEKLTADKFRLDLKRKYKEGKEKGLRLLSFEEVLDGLLYKVFRSDEFKQMKLYLTNKTQLN
jgi:hypothetical protein